MNFPPFASRPILALALALVPSANATVVVLNPSLDNTIYSENDNSNALGPLYLGRTPTPALRRALLQFDLSAGGIPTGAIVTSVTLTLTQTKIGAGTSALVELRPLLAAWGAGTSTGTGQGAAPTTDDATWNFRLYNANSWTAAGGDFGATSGTATFGTALTTYSFSSQTGMVADVQSWLDAPAGNFGWLLRTANESTGNSARELGSRESALADQPALTITFTAVPEPAALPLLGLAAALILLRRGRGRSPA